MDDDAPETGSVDGESTSSGSMEAEAVDVSVVVPALNEVAYLGETLSSLAALDTDLASEVLVVDGGSTDGTRSLARTYGVRVLERPGSSIAAARNAGAREATGEWLAFVDADTRVRRDYLTRLLGFALAEGLAAASSRCRIDGPLRATAMEATINHVFPRLARPVLPGFNTLVHREAFAAVGGYPEVLNEDTAFSRRLGRRYPTGYCDATLVETSGRRIAKGGLSGTLVHYLRLDSRRLRASR